MRPLLRPLLRNATPLFPRECLTLRPNPSAERQTRAARPPYTTAKHQELQTLWSSSLAAVADGQTVGVLTEPAPEDDPAAEHRVATQRVRVLSIMSEPTVAGFRLAELEPLVDAELSDADQALLAAEASAARDLIAEARRGAFVLTPCTLDEELEKPLCEPARHPLWEAANRPPDDAVALSFWLGARLPLATPLRQHLLECVCPLKRMRDAVDAARMLSASSADASRYNPGTSRPSKFTLTYDTAEASGCELEAPRAIITWA